jgi:ISXO2-like transposase domain
MAVLGRLARQRRRARAAFGCASSKAASSGRCSRRCENVEPGANLYTDAFASYYGMNRTYVHQVIDHAEAYVDGNVDTSGLENFGRS